MRVFKEFLLDDHTLGEQFIYMPCNTEIVGLTTTVAGHALLAITKPDNYDTSLPEKRIFKICLTEEIFYANTIKYIGSFESLVGIKHVIEINKE